MKQGLLESQLIHNLSQCLRRESVAIMGQRPLLLNEWARLNSMGNKQLLLFFPLKERKTQDRVFNSLCLSS